MMSEKIRILLIKRQLSAKELAKKLNTTPANISNKLRRDNFSENELKEIASILNCDFEACFIMRDTGEKI